MCRGQSAKSRKTRQDAHSKNTLRTYLPYTCSMSKPTRALVRKAPSLVPKKKKTLGRRGGLRRTSFPTFKKLKRVQQDFELERWHNVREPCQYHHRLERRGPAKAFKIFDFQQAKPPARKRKTLIRSGSMDLPKDVINQPTLRVVDSSSSNANI